jgi:hypothetical protein
MERSPTDPAKHLEQALRQVDESEKLAPEIEQQLRKWIKVNMEDDPAMEGGNLELGIQAIQSLGLSGTPETVKRAWQIAHELGFERYTDHWRKTDSGEL